MYLSFLFCALVVTDVLHKSLSTSFSANSAISNEDDMKKRDRGKTRLEFKLSSL